MERQVNNETNVKKSRRSPRQRKPKNKTDMIDNYGSNNSSYSLDECSFGESLKEENFESKFISKLLNY